MPKGKYKQHKQNQDAVQLVEELIESQTEYWGDPKRSHNEIRHEDGGRALYVLDPGGHLVELLTRPYV